MRFVRSSRLGTGGTPAGVSVVHRIQGPARRSTGQLVPAVPYDAWSTGGFGDRLEALGAESATAEFASIVAQRFVHDLDTARHLVADEALGQECEQFVRLEFAGIGFDDRVDNAAKVVIWQPDHRTGLHRWVFRNGCLDLRR